MNEKNKYGHLERFIPAIINSWAGLKVAYREEIAFRQYVWLTCILGPVALYLSESLPEFAILISPLFLMLVTELLNTAIEAAIDRIGLEKHELSGKAKDLGSAAVFVSIGYFVLVWSYKVFTLF